MMTTILCFDEGYKLDHRIALCKVLSERERHRKDLEYLGQSPLKKHDCKVLG